MNRILLMSASAAMLVLLAGCGGGSRYGDMPATSASSSSSTSALADGFTSAVTLIAATTSEATLPVVTEGITATVVETGAPVAVN